MKSITRLSHRRWLKDFARIKNKQQTIQKTMRVTSAIIRAFGDRLRPHAQDETRLCILNYHQILESFDPLLEWEPSVESFRWQMELLADCFNVIPLYDAVTSLLDRALPPRAACITFDDGYRSTYELALPILKQFCLPATVFVTTGEGEERNMWNDRILESARRLPKGRLDLRDVGLEIYPFDTDWDRKSVVNKLMETSKYLRPDRRTEVIKKLETLAAHPHPRGLMLTSEMILGLSNEGMEIGGHTLSHPILTSLKDQAAWHEIIENKRQLQAITGKPIRLFAYPNGKAGKDFNDRHVQMVKDAGYAAAFTTASGAATPNHDRYQMPRSRPWDSMPLMFGMRLLSWSSNRSVFTR
jgi:peptidoglycan/xylan/chitin deacetylase (PgdA/CDA1 family)